MEAIVLCGLQGSGKSTLYKERWADTHIRISLDMLNGNRNRETILLMACLSMRQSFVVDNTNATARERKYYTDLAKAAGFKVRCYYLNEDIDRCLVRNSKRLGKARIPEGGIRATLRRFEPPTAAEGWNDLVILENS
jgi:predicted kinase